VLSSGVFAPVWWLHGTETAFLQELSNFTLREAFAEGEVIPHVARKVGKSGQEYDEWRLCLLVSGVANRAGSIITSGAYWGDVILTNPMLRDSRAATAMSFCEVASLSRAGLDEINSKYPKSAALIRQAALKLATKRSMLVSAMYCQTHPDVLPSLQGERGISPSKTLKAMHSLLNHGKMLWREPEDMGYIDPTGVGFNQLAGCYTPPKDTAPSPPGPSPTMLPIDGASGGASSGAGSASASAGSKGKPSVVLAQRGGLPVSPESKLRKSASRSPPSGTQAFSQLVLKLDNLEEAHTKLASQMAQMLELLFDRKSKESESERQRSWLTPIFETREKDPSLSA